MTAIPPPAPMRRSTQLVLPVALALGLAACGASTDSVPTTTPTATPSQAVVQEKPLATLNFDPAALSLKVGETKEVKVLLDLKTYSSSTYQAEITFDPKLVEVVDIDAKNKDAHISLGMYETPIINKVEDGRIRFAGYSLTKGKEAAGQGTLATITLKGKAEGTTTLAFDRVAGSGATKTKLIRTGTTTDVLLSVGTATVTVTK